jgi:hypothetical protein
MPAEQIEECLKYWNTKAEHEQEEMEKAKRGNIRDELLRGLPPGMTSHFTPGPAQPPQIIRP